MQMTRNSYSNFAYVTTADLKFIFLRLGIKKDTLDFIKNLPSCEQTSSCYRADSNDLLDYLKTNFTKWLENNKINNVLDLYSSMVNWCERYSDE